MRVHLAVITSADREAGGSGRGTAGGPRLGWAAMMRLLWPRRRMACDVAGAARLAGTLALQGSAPTVAPSRASLASRRRRRLRRALGGLGTTQAEHLERRVLLAGDSFDTGLNPEAWTMPASEPSAEVCVPTGEWDYPHDLGSIATANVQAEEEARRQAEMQAQMEAYASMAAATASVDVSLGMAASGVSDGFMSDGFMSEHATTDPMASMSFDAAAYATGAVPLPSSPSPSSGEASTAPAQAPTQASGDSAQAATQSPGSAGPTRSTQTRTDEGPSSGSTTIIVTGEGYRSSTVSFWINQSGYRETSTSLSEEWWSEGFYRSTTLTSGTKTSSTTETQSWSTDERGATRSGNSTRTDTRTETWEYSFSFEGPSRGVGAYSSRQSTTVVSDSSWTSSGDSTDPLPGGTSSGSHDSSGSDSSTWTHVITTVGETYSWSDTTQVITESGFGAASSTAKAGSSYDDASISATGLAWYSGGSQSDAFASSSYTYATSMRQRSQVFSDGTESHAPWVCDGSQTLLVFERDGGTWWASSTRHSLTPTSLSSRDRDSNGSDSTVYVGVFRSKRDTSGFWSTTGTGTVITSADSSSRYRGGETSGSPGDGTGSSMSFADKDTSSSSSNITYAYDDINGWLATSGSMTSSGSGTGTFTWSESDLEESGTTTNGFRSSAKSGGTDNTRYGYTKTSTKSNGGSWKTTGSGSRGGDGSSNSSYDESVAVESAGGKASETADGYDESEYEWSATYTYSDPKPVDPYGYDPSAYDSSGSDAGGWRAVSGTASSSASGAHNSSWSVSSESSTGLGPLQLSAKFNGSGRQTSAYGKWTSSTIGDSGTWVTTGTGVSTDSSTLSLSFSGGVTLGEGGPGVSVSGSHDRASRSIAASAYDDEKGWHTTSGSRSQSGSGGGNMGTTAGYGIVGGSGAGFSYEFSLNSTSESSGTSSTSGSASATLSWSGTGDTGQTGGGITARARYDGGDGWKIVSVGPATTAGSGDDSSLNSLPRERPDLPLGSWTDQDRAAAFFADLVYTWEGSGFHAIGVDYNPEHGFAASLFQDSDGTYYLAFRGTEFYSWNDWRTNVRQGLGLSASQYQQAIELAKRVKDALPKGARLILTGHSLGGGLASAASYDTGLDAITFNAATPNRHYTRGKVSGEIRSHVVIGDPLSVGRTTGIVNRDLPGTVIPHLPRVANTHAMDNFPFYR